MNTQIICMIFIKILKNAIQYDIYREGLNVSALSSGKIDKYEYIVDKKLLHSNQSQIIKPAKFTYSNALLLVKHLKNK